MDRRLVTLLESIRQDKKLRCTEEFLLIIFDNNFNPEKGETRNTELKRWLEWAAIQYNFTWWKPPIPGVMPEIYFKSNIE